MKIEFSHGSFFLILQISNLMKIYPMAAELFHAQGQVDRRMDRTTLIVAFRNFANVPKNTYIRAHMQIRFQDPKIPVFEQYGEVLCFAQLP
jgi:hypothetical protein